MKGVTEGPKGRSGARPALNPSRLALRKKRGGKLGDPDFGGES